MKSLILSTYDIQGGAARAAYRLHKGLQSIGVASQMLVQAKYSDDGTVVAPLTKKDQGIAKLKPTLDALPLQLYRQRNRASYSLQWLPDVIAPIVAEIAPEVINLHWINNGYIKIETISKFKKPIVWTLHDMWAFTGGCHYSQDCDRYTKSCGACPQLHSRSNWDLSHWIWKRKVKAWKDLNLTIVTPSKWLAKSAEASSLFQNFRLKIIPYGLDINIYKPISRQLARNLLNLPQDKQLILFGAIGATSDQRKGFHLLQPALKILNESGWQGNIELVVFGTSQPSDALNLDLKSHYLGRLSDDISLALVYAAADIFVAPSTQDNLPNTVMEALACGIPCVAFKVGGMPDMIEHQKNGYLAQPFDSTDLAMGIVWVLEDSDRYQQLSYHAREKTEQEFSMELQAQRYLTLFNQVLDRDN